MIFSIFLGFFSSIFFGNLLFWAIGLKHRSNFIFVVSLGAAAVAYWLLLLASLTLLEKSYVSASLTFFSAVGLYQFAVNSLVTYRMKDFFNKISSLKNHEKILVSVILLILVLSTFEVFAPATTEDTTSYHFRIPYDYVTNGSLVYSPSLLYNMPHLTEVLITLPFSFEINDTAAQIFFYFWIIVFVASLITLGAEIFDVKVSLLATTLIITTPMFTYIKTAGMVEVSLASFIILSILAFTYAFKDNKVDYRWIIISGCCSGAACGVKYYGLLWTAAISCGLFIYLLTNRINHKTITISVFIFGCLLLSFPFYLKNYLLTGDPLFPKLYSILGGVNWSNEMAQALNAYTLSDKKPGGKSMSDLIQIPWNLTMDGEKFLNGKTGYGFVFLLFLPLAIVYSFVGRFDTPLKNKIRITRFLWVFIFISVIFWFYFALHRGRHLFPIYAILSLMVANAFYKLNLPEVKKLLKPLTISAYKLIFVISIILNVFISIYFNSQFFRVATGLETRREFLESVKSEALIYEVINSKLSGEVKVLHLFGTNQYYLRWPQYYPSPYFQGWIDWSIEGGVKPYYEKLKREGFTHIIAPSIETLIQRSSTGSKPVYANIRNFNLMNAKLLQRYGTLVEEYAYHRKNSRTFPTEHSKGSIKLYELKK